MVKLVILCVDGLDPDYARELGFPKMPYESKLDISKDLYHDGAPHTRLVWPSMLSGRKVVTEITGLRDIWLHEMRIPIRRFLHKLRIRWRRKEGKWKVNPMNINIETVADRYNSVMWNIPTICPEFVFKFPDQDYMLQYGRHEYEIWKIVSYGMCMYPYHLSLAYCHLPDFYGHLKKPLEEIYLDIHYHAKMLSKYRPVMLVSDHGCLDGEHTHHAYLGCTEPVEAKRVLEVRSDIERILSKPHHEDLSPASLVSDVPMLPHRSESTL